METLRGKIREELEHLTLWQLILVYLSLELPNLSVDEILLYWLRCDTAASPPHDLVK
jgi:hypothetical protein